MSAPIIDILIAAFILFELWFAITRALKVQKALNTQRQFINEVGNALLQAKEDSILDYNSNTDSFPAAAYLMSCAQNGQQINTESFRHLLTGGVNNIFDYMSSVINSLPIIGLMGTFSGIIVGVYSTNIKSSAIKDLDPLISAAGLAFISSLVALILASILKGFYNKWKKGIDADIETTERNLLVKYIPLASGTTTDEIFAKSVRRLERSVSGFSEGFQSVTTDFLAQFRPLVNDQKESNERTARHLDSIAASLEENARMLHEVSEKQKEQVDAVTGVTTKLTEASDALQASMRLASENLEKFVKLGDEMQEKIGKLHEPLQTIIEGQKLSVEKLSTMYDNLINFNQNLQEYISAFNSKMDQFGEVGTKVQGVSAKFDDFKTNLEKTLQQITEQALLIQKELKDSFEEYDRNLRTLFTDVITGNREVHMAYYDPELMKQVDKISKDNKQLLDSMERHLGTLENSTRGLVSVISSLKGWGIYRVKSDKLKKDGSK